jgi:hypothetical protein
MLKNTTSGANRPVAIPIPSPSPPKKNEKKQENNKKKNTLHYKSTIDARTVF